MFIAKNGKLIVLLENLNKEESVSVEIGMLISILMESTSSCQEKRKSEEEREKGRNDICLKGRPNAEPSPTRQGSSGVGSCEPWPGGPI